MKNIIKGSVVSASLVASTLSYAVTLGTYDGTTVTLGGFAKLDAMFSDFSDGAIEGDASRIGREFYIPSLTPVGGKSQNTFFDMHAKQTRINFGTSSEVDGHTVKTFIELDFMATAGGDERISNSYTPRVRHAFLSFDKWLFGQTWTTFQNVGALPETADFIGNTDFGIFARQPQVRYTNGPWQFSIENPETVVTTSPTTKVVTDDNELPDLVGRYNLENGQMSASFAVLLRQLSYNDGDAVDATTTAYGLSFSGKYKVGDDDFRFGINTGSGMGRYIALNVGNDAIINGDSIDAIDSTALYVGFRHVWNSKARSNITYSTITIDNDMTLSAPTSTSKTESLRVNYFYSPIPKLTFGGELAFAKRTQESNASGDMTRLQFIAKLDF